MPRNQSYLPVFTMLIFFGVFIACQTEPSPDPFSTNRGFMEQEYPYTVTSNGSLQNKKGYKRANLTQAFFAIRDKSTLPDSLSRFREVEVVLLSEAGEYTLASQPTGVSSVRIVLADTLTDPGRILPWTYISRTPAAFYEIKPKRPVCLGLSGILNIAATEKPGEVAFNSTIIGQDTKPVSVLYLGNDIYQISANGISGSNVYNIFYTGKIQKEKNL